MQGITKSFKIKTKDVKSWNLDFYNIFLRLQGEETILKAAESLNVTQPTLSRQMKELEDHLQKQLFIRGNRKITLTEEGILLRQRAEEIVSLVEKTESEIMLFDETLSGEVCIGSGETLGTKSFVKPFNVYKKIIHVSNSIYSVVMNKM